MKRDVINFHFALTNNISSISFSSNLDPIIEPLYPSTLVFHTFQDYLDYFDQPIDMSKLDEPDIVEYYLTKHKLKSFDEMILDYEGNDEEDLFMVEINDYVSYGNINDFYLVDYFSGKFFESFNNKLAIDFYEEGERVACESGNERGAKICRNNYERLIREIEDD